jgi:L-alanine-DL-glutamate epimerase-like enolase superfamily enzyme
MIDKARELNMGVMVGSMNESTIGSAAIAHLQSRIDYLDADGPLLLREDIATGLAYENNGTVALLIHQDWESLLRTFFKKING